MTKRNGATNNKQRTTNNKQQTTDNKQQTTNHGQLSTIDLIQSMNENLDDLEFEERRVDWVYLEIRGMELHPNETVEQAFQLSTKYGAEVKIFGSLILMTLGTIPGQIPVEGRQKQMIAELTRTFGHSVKILYGSVMAHCGFLTGGLFQYALVTPQFTEARQQVVQLDWGQIAEFQSKAHV